MKKLFFRFYFVFLLPFSFCFSQNDSLWNVYNHSKIDSNRLKAIHAIAWSYIGNNPDSAILLANREFQLAYRSKLKVFQGKALNIIGVAFTNKGEYRKALDYYFQALKVREELNDKAGIGSCYANIGLVYDNQSNYPKALEHYLKALKIADETGDNKGTANCYVNIGNVYYNQSNYQKALDYYLKALKIRERIGEKNGVGICYNNIAGVYKETGKTREALDYYFKSLHLQEEIGDKQSIGDCYGNIGNIYSDQSNYPQALKYLLQSLKIRREIEDINGLGDCFINIGGVYNRLKNYKKAIHYSDSALAISKELGNIDNQLLAYQNLSAAYAKTDRFKEAYNYHVKFKTLTDSLFSAENISSVANQEAKVKEEKREAEVKEQQIKEAAKLKQQKIISLSFTVGFALVLILIFVVLRNLKMTKGKNKIIENQKIEVEQKNKLVEHKQKEILDSINYAKRLQQAILPSLSDVKRNLPESFLYYNPKDIVAGDFYWMETEGDKVWIAAADCTGHGVPGAMVSVVCSNALNQSFKEFKLRDPGKILDKTRELVLETFSKSDRDVKDGMDISLCCIDLKKRELKWAGANNPLWYVQNEKINEITATKQPIGKTENPVPFLTHNIQLNPNDSVYLFTDGYADQFGGPKGKKLKYKQMSENILSGIDKPLYKQGELIEMAFELWKGELEQVDDVCVIGIRV